MKLSAKKREAAREHNFATLERWAVQAAESAPSTPGRRIEAKKRQDAQVHALAKALGVGVVEQPA